MELETLMTDTMVEAVPRRRRIPTRATATATITTRRDDHKIPIGPPTPNETLRTTMDPEEVITILLMTAMITMGDQTGRGLGRREDLPFIFRICLMEVFNLCQSWQELLTWPIEMA